MQNLYWFAQKERLNGPYSCRGVCSPGIIRQCDHRWFFLAMVINAVSRFKVGASYGVPVLAIRFKSNRIALGGK